MNRYIGKEFRLKILLLKIEVKQIIKKKPFLNLKKWETNAHLFLKETKDGVKTKASWNSLYRNPIHSYIQLKAKSKYTKSCTKSLEKM